METKGIEDTPENYKKFNYNLFSQLMGEMAPEEQTEEKEEIEQPDNNSDYPFGHIMSEQRFNEISCMLSGMDWPIEKQIKRVCHLVEEKKLIIKQTLHHQNQIHLKSAQDVEQYIIAQKNAK